MADSLKVRIDADIKEAMRRQNKIELTALRAIKALILLAEKGKEGLLDKTTENRLLMRAVKQRREAAAIFEKEKRNALYEKEMAELKIISRYLPELFTQDRLDDEIKKIITTLNASGLQDMGKVMGVATKTLMGRAEGKAISETVRRLLLT